MLVLRDLLRFLYGPQKGDETTQTLEQRLEAFRRTHPQLQDAPAPAQRLTSRDAVLITYGDQFRSPDEPPLQSLHRFLRTHLKESISAVHLLPFFPYSSDDGFSVIDYRQVNPDLGTWEHIRALEQDYRLMFDAVINHVSRESAWFQGFLRGEAPYRDYFIVVDPDTDLSQVVRPRPWPLLTKVETAQGVKYVWTTFSADQIDLNYANPAVLLEIADILLFYVAHGARIIRLDAIAYLWKEIGTPCIHLPQTHTVVKLFRAMLDRVAPGVLLITETNVPHEENIAYFGDGYDEAQLVYNFTLPPLTLHALHTGNAARLTAWARTLRTPSQATTFFNFLASHDGIGVRPAEGWLAPEEIQALADVTLAHGGRVSTYARPDGSQAPYELNITWYDALNDPNAPSDNDIPRFMASQAIMLSLAGVPGIYVHSLFGSRNCQKCYQQTQQPRSLNREKFSLAALEAKLADPSTREARILRAYRRLLDVRQAQAAFHPQARQEILDVHPGVFAVRRGEGQETILALISVREEALTLRLENDIAASRPWQDLLSEDVLLPGADGRLLVPLAPYQVRWLKMR
ncbi:MAG: sugar phosphorylase [Chloroflexi bacterium]|nr:sugar phosphorylase [Chloroflexota bacterium]